jgi:hypothetical protein
MRGYTRNRIAENKTPLRSSCMHKLTCASTTSPSARPHPRPESEPEPEPESVTPGAVDVQTETVESHLPRRRASTRSSDGVEPDHHRRRRFITLGLTLATCPINPQGGRGQLILAAPHASGQLACLRRGMDTNPWALCSGPFRMS